MNSRSAVDPLPVKVMSLMRGTLAVGNECRPTEVERPHDAARAATQASRAAPTIVRRLAATHSTVPGLPDSNRAPRGTKTTGDSQTADAADSPTSIGILLEGSRAWRQLNPRVPTAVVDGNLRCWKVRVSKRAHGDAHRLIVTFFGVEDGSPTDWAEPQYELGSLIPDTDVFRGGTEDFERSGEAGQCCKNTAGPLLAGEAVAKANSSWFAFDLNTQLSAGARGCSGRRH